MKLLLVCGYLSQIRFNPLDDVSCSLLSWLILSFETLFFDWWPQREHTHDPCRQLWPAGGSSPLLLQRLHEETGSQIDVILIVASKLPATTGWHTPTCKWRAWNLVRRELETSIHPFSFTYPGLGLAACICGLILLVTTQSSWLEMHNNISMSSVDNGF